jgi:hypothetical protein
MSVIAVLGVAGTVLAAGCTPTPGSWSRTASMATPRYEHAASLLPRTGRVLVTGGRSSTDLDAPALRSAERYDPATASWTTVAPMGSARARHTATALADGRILVAGGAATASAEVFDGPTNTWTATGPMKKVRAGAFAVRLSNGRVLVAGGGPGAEVYNPGTNAWTATGAIPTGVVVPPGDQNTEIRLYRREVDGLVPLSSDRALAIVGSEILELPDCPGVCGSSYTKTDVVVYTASTNSWALAPNMPVELIDTTSTLLSNGRVLVLGGDDGEEYERFASSRAQIYDPGSGAWLPRSPMAARRVRHSATLLADGRVLVVGGSDECCSSEGAPWRSTEAYVPPDKAFAPLPPMSKPREGHVAVRLADGRVLVAGGLGGYDANFDTIVRASAEVFRPS